MCAELGMADMELADRSVGRSALSAMSQHGRMVVFGAMRRIRRIGRSKTPVKKRETQRRRTGDDSLQTYDAPSESKASNMFVLLETLEYTRSNLSMFKIAKAKAGKRKTYSERTKLEFAIVEAGVQADFKRAESEGKVDTFDAQVDAAALNIMSNYTNPLSYQLLNVEPKSREYLVKDMAETLMTLRHRQDSTIDIKAGVEALLKNKTKKEVLRTLLTVEFFGEGWKTRFLPKNVPAVLQAEGVKKAKEMSTPEMVQNGTAWAWKVSV